MAARDVYDSLDETEIRLRHVMDIEQNGNSAWYERVLRLSKAFNMWKVRYFERLGQAVADTRYGRCV